MSYDTGPEITSYAKAHAPASVANGFAFKQLKVEPFSTVSLPQKTVSVLSRPYKPSNKNTENLDAQHRRDQEAFERTAATYRRQAHLPYHHNKPPEAYPTLWEQGHIVDKGRGKEGSVRMAAEHGVVNPITLASVVEPSSPNARPSSAPNNSYAAMHRHRASAASHAQASFNPITHQPRSGTAHSSQPPHYNSSASCAPVSPPPAPHTARGSRVPERSSVAYDIISMEPRAPSGAHDSHASGRPSSAYPPTSPRACVRNSVSWGTYNPVLGTWDVPPQDPRFVDQSALVERRAGVTGQSKARGAELPSQGIYNPITGTWTVPPKDPRAAQGLTFAPATLFTKPTPATIRM